MTNRQRIIDTLTGKATDRVPFGVGLGFWLWGETHRRWQSESGIADLDLARYFGFDASFQVVPLAYGPFPAFESIVLEQDDQFVVSRNERGIVVRNRLDHSSMPDFLSHPIKSEADWQPYKAERLQPRLDERTAKLDDFVSAMGRTDAPVQVGVFPWGVFGTPRDLLGAEELLYAFHDSPEMVRDMMVVHTDLWLALYERVATKIAIDHIHIWEDMSGRQGSLISMDMVERFMMPQYDRIVAFARSRGVPIVSVDTDGWLGQLVPVYLAHGINMVMPFEAQAGNDVEDYRRRYPDMGIMGGLDKNALAEDRAAIHRQLDLAARMIQRGRFIPGCDHLIPPNVAWADWCYFVKHLRKLCGA